VPALGGRPVKSRTAASIILLWLGLLLGQPPAYACLSNSDCSSTQFCNALFACVDRSSAGEGCSVFQLCLSGLVCDASLVCRHDPPRKGEPCGIGVSCASGLTCSAAIGGTCVQPAQAGESCTGTGQGTCASGLVCDISGVCRHQPPQQGEPCGEFVSCASGLTCSALVAGTCQAPKQAGEACFGTGQGNCDSGLLCDFSGVCRHDPPQQGEPCGEFVSCASGLTCSALVAGTCIRPRQAGQSCVGLGQGSCDTGLVCDAGSATCRHDPPQAGETCGVLVSCAPGLACYQAACIPIGDSGDPCDPLVSGACKTGLVCDLGSDTCRHNPPQAGETCGVLVPCANGLTCIAATCVQRAAAGQHCDFLVGDSCQDGLVCDVGSGTCRHDPPQAGETCGVLVSCAGNLTCLAATCVERRAAGQSCDILVSNSCQDGLVCDAGDGRCRHNPPLLGETCGVLVPCADGLTCFNFSCREPGGSGDLCDPLVTGTCNEGMICDAGSGTCRHDPPRAGETCGVLVPCAGGLTCIGATCVERAAAGEHCDFLVTGSCQDGLVCDAGSGTCRHDPPRLGETCGVLVPCAGDLTCIGATCVARAVAGEHCDFLVGNSCQDGLVCDAGSGICRHDPPQLGETCGLLVPCADGLACFAAQCVKPGAAGGVCDPLVGNSCQSGLVCDAGSHHCRHDPPQLGETCGLLVPCADGLACFAAQCVTPGGSGTSCDPLVADSCSGGLVCDLGSHTCRHDPPQQGETCGLLVPCADGLTCYAARCVTPGSSGTACDPLVTTSCEAGLLCDPGSFTCRHDPPELGETCGLLVPCADGLACFAAQCVPPGAAGEHCDPLVADSCQSGLVCDGGSFSCRHDPPQLGETCGLLVPCAGGLACYAAQCVEQGDSGAACDPLVADSCRQGLLCDLGSRTCRHDPPREGETCGLLAPCVTGLACVEATCRMPGAANDPCNLLVPDSCQSGLVCDVNTSRCRHNPPLAGESCGLAQCSGGLTCLDSTCMQPGVAGAHCDPLVGGSCITGLVCDAFAQVCRHDPPVYGERCGPAVPCDQGVCDAIGECRHTVPELGEPCGLGVSCIPELACAGPAGVAGRCVVPAKLGEACLGIGRGSCETGLVCDIAGTCRHDPPQRGEPCGQFVNCATGLACDAVIAGHCDTPRVIGEACAGFGQGNCATGLTCNLVFEDGGLVTRCFPDGNGIIPPQVCRRMYSPALSRTAQRIGAAQTYGLSGASGAIAASTAESGTAYGAGGEFGCYNTLCAGVVTDVTIGVAACTGLYNSYGAVNGDSSASVESVTVTEQGLTLSTAQIYTSFNHPPVSLIGTADCLGLAVGKAPADIGVYNCTTQVTDANPDSNGDGLPDSEVAPLNLDPAAPNGDTDGDGVPDSTEIGADVMHPLDSDHDGVIDALEPGAAATDASIASDVPLPDGKSVTITSLTGELLSGVASASNSNAPSGIDFPFGVISYTVTAPVGGSVTVRLVFSADLPSRITLYKVDHDGNYSRLPAASWRRIDRRTLEITLTDGDPLTDLDGAVNGSIDDPVSVGVAAPANGGGSGGDGGCSMRPRSGFDPLFAFMLAGLWLAGVLRRRSNAGRLRPVRERRR
jgi:hypothetical protein